MQQRSHVPTSSALVHAGLCSLMSLLACSSSLCSRRHSSTSQICKSCSLLSQGSMPGSASPCLQHSSGNAVTNWGKHPWDGLPQAGSCNAALPSRRAHAHISLEGGKHPPDVHAWPPPRARPTPPCRSRRQDTVLIQAGFNSRPPLWPWSTARDAGCPPLPASQAGPITAPPVRPGRPATCDCKLLTSWASLGACPASEPVPEPSERTWAG